VTELAKEDWELLAAWRGIAAMLVAVGHMVQVFIYPGSTWLAPYSGLLAQASVMIFFVISGCSIAASGFSLLEANNPVRKYIWNRMARIWPPLIFSMLLMWCLWLLAPKFFPTGTASFMPGERLAREGFYFDWGKAGLSFLFLNGFVGQTILTNGPLWSLSYEVWLYFIFFFFLIGQKSRFRWLSIFSMFIYLILATLDLSRGSMIFARYSLVWGAGVIVFFVLQSERKSQRCEILFFPAALTGLFALHLARLFILRDMNDDIWPFNVQFGLFFAIYLSMRMKLMKRIQQWGIYVSKFGYTLYLIHFPIFLFAFGVTQRVVTQSWVFAWAAGVCTLLIATCFAKISATLLENRRLFLKLAKLN